MKVPEKLGRAAWIGYLILASPIALLSVAMWVLSVFLAFRENNGPVEDAPASIEDRVIMMGSFITFPVVWFLSIFIAHRFNAGRWALIPFLANLLPTIGILRFSLILRRDEGREFVWAVFHTGFLVALLLLGIISVMFASRPQTPD